MITKNSLTFGAPTCDRRSHSPQPNNLLEERGRDNSLSPQTGAGSSGQSCPTENRQAEELAPRVIPAGLRHYLVTARLMLAAILLAGMTACHHKTPAKVNAPPPKLEVTEMDVKLNALKEEVKNLTPTPGGTSQPAAAPKPTLGDYIPCRFTDTAENWLRTGFTPPLDGKVAAGASDKQDIGCSQSVLTWEETRWIFGRKIADNYIAFQVTARNLNPDQEFLVHDLQVAVADFSANPDSQPAPPGNGIQPSACAIPLANSYFTHFLAARDRMLVRGVGQTGQAFTSRNVTERVLEAVGSVFSATAAVAGTAQFSSAVHIFSAAGVPGFNKVVPDLNADQIDRLNDLGFSATSAYKVIIPKNGAVPMTTFLPSAIFAANYRHWSPCELLNFANNAVVVLGGKHIQEVSDVPSLKDVKCPLVDGYVDLSKSSGGNLKCDISGTDLQLLTAVRLKNDADSSDKTTLDGTASLSGSTTAGTVTFPVKQLEALAAPRYQVYAEGAKGESASTVRLSLPPAAASVAPTQITLDGKSGCDSNGTTCTVTIKGNNLDLANDVKLLKSSDNSIAAAGAWQHGSSKTDGTATFQLADIKKLQSGDYVIGFVSKDGTVIPSSGKLTLAAPSGGGN